MLKQENEKELSQNTTPNQEQKIDYTKYEPYVEYYDKILGPVAKEVDNIQNQIENLVDDLGDLIQGHMFTVEGKKTPIGDTPLKRLAEKGIMPEHLGKRPGSTPGLDKKIAQWCRDSNEKIPVAPLTVKEKELLQQTLTKKALCEDDFTIMAIREKLKSSNELTPFHDDRRPLPL